MAYVPGMPSSGIPEEERKKAEKAYEKKQKEQQQKEEKKQKEQEKKQTSPATNISVPGMPSNLPGSVQQQAQQAYENRKQTEKQVQQNLIPDFYKNLPDKNSLINTAFGVDASKVLANTNAATAFNKIVKPSVQAGTLTFQEFVNKETNNRSIDKDSVNSLPSAVREKIAKQAMSGKLNTHYAKEVLKNYRAMNTNKTSESFDDQLSHAKTDTAPKQCTYVTASQWVQMNKDGYHTVLVEDGCGTLADKRGVYTIGRDNLAGLPSDVKTVMVDKDGNWKYVANSGERAKFVEAARINQETTCSVLLDQYNDASHSATNARNKLEVADNAVQYLLDVANKTRKKEDIARYQEAIEARAALYQEYKDYSASAADYGQRYAKLYDSFEQSIQGKQGWTVTDELTLQELKSKLAFTPNSQKQSSNYAMLFSAYSELSKRKMQYGDGAVFMTEDAMEDMRKNAENIQKAVDQYNKWDSLLIHQENGETFNAHLRKSILQELHAAWDTATFAFRDDITLHDVIQEQLDVRSKTDVETGKSLQKIFTDIKDIPKAAWDEWHHAKDALDTGKINYAQFMDEEKYISNQLKSVIFNNTMATLDIFDFFSVQKEFVAYRMALHPERYTDDPTFKRLKEAYKDIMGTDFNGSMDAAKMAYTMMQVEAGAYNDYIYLDASNLKNAGGENFGFFRSMAVGMYTDPTFLLSAVKGGVGLVTKAVGAKELANVAQDALTQSLVRSGVAKESAEAFAKANAGKLYVASYSAMRRTMNSGTDDLLKTFVNIQKDKFYTLSTEKLDDVARAIEEIGCKKFIDNAVDVLNETAPTVVEKSFAINKGKVITSALYTADEAVNEFQTALFKASCPVAGAVTALSKAFEITKALNNSVIANKFKSVDVEHLCSTGKQRLAEVLQVSFETVTDPATFDATVKQARKAFYEAALEDSVKVDDAIAVFKGYSDHAMTGYADSYTYGALDNLKKIMHDGEDGLEKLEQYALEKGFQNTDEMLSTVKSNLSKMQEFSTNTNAILNSFELDYTQQVINKKLKDVNTAVKGAKGHYKDLRSFTSPSETHVFNIQQLSPAEIQGACQTMADSIRNFAKLMNPDFAQYADEFGEIASVYTSADDAIKALEHIALGDYTSVELLATQDLVNKYADDVKRVYIKNIEDWQANMKYDALGVSGDLQRIEDVSKAYADEDMVDYINRLGEKEAVEKEIVGNLVEQLSAAGYDADPSEVAKAFLKDSDYTKKPIESLDTVYRIMLDKGTNSITQIHDANLSQLTWALTDVNSETNKTLRLYQHALESNKASAAANAVISNRINNAISNASAVESTRAFSNVLRGSVDDVTYTGIMDSWIGQSSSINRTFQMCSHDEAVERITNMIVNDTQQQLALHAGKYPHMHEYGADTVDVVANTKKIAEICDIPEEEQYVDIFFSATKSADGAPPKDIAFQIRGAEGDPFVLRRNYAFDIHDDALSARLYGCNAAAARAQYEALGNTGGLSRDEWMQQLQDFLTQQKELALADGKTIRFIGFNSADAVSGSNRFLNDTIRSCGININTANAMDYANVLRRRAGQGYILDDDAVAGIRRSVNYAMSGATTRGITLNINPVLSYDSKLTCADTLSDLFKNIREQNVNPMFAEPLQMIQEAAKKTVGSITQSAYEKAGFALGLDIDMGELRKILGDASDAPARINQQIMNSVRDVLKDGNQFGLHKVFDQQYVSAYFDTSKINPKLFNLEYADKMYSATQRINNIRNSLRRVDLLSEADRQGFEVMFKHMLQKTPSNSPIFGMIKTLKISELDVTDLYAVDVWLKETLTQCGVDLGETSMLLMSPRAASMLSPEMVTFMKTNVVDFSDDFVDKFKIKYLNDSEDGYKFAQQLETMNYTSNAVDGIREYDKTLHTMFQENGSHGVQDNLLLMQSAAVYNPIIDMENSLKQVFEENYNKAMVELMTPHTVTNEAGEEIAKTLFDEDVAHKLATQRAAEAYDANIKRFSNDVRMNAVHEVAKLDKEGMRAHLIRNCGGGLVIDPNAACIGDLDLPQLFKQWEEYGLKVEQFKFSGGIVNNRTLFKVTDPSLATANMDEVFRKYNHTRVQFNNATTKNFNKGMRHSSFDASDMTLFDGNHAHNFKELFFKNDTIIDLENRFKPWTDELYCCNMWTDMDLKQLINPYYTDNAFTNLIQNTHQMRNNISALHDLGSVMNNPYMRTSYIVSNCMSSRLKGLSEKARVKAIKRELRAQNQRMCKIVADGDKFRILDYTGKINAKNYNDLAHNTILLDKGMYDVMSDWTKATSIAVQMAQNSDNFLTLPHMYKLYKDTIRSATITWYLYGNIGTGVRNLTDSSTKAINEVLQYNADLGYFLKKYATAVEDKKQYDEICALIKEKSGTVNRDSIADWFGDDVEGLNRFNIFYGYENTSGGNALIETATEDSRAEMVKYLTEETNLTPETAEQIRRVWDSTFALPQYRVLTNAERANKMTQIYNDCMRRTQEFLDKEGKVVDMDALGKKFWDYHPTTETLGDKMIAHSKLLQLNKSIFDSAEDRARLALYQTFLEAGETEAGAMAHVTATQFNYAGIGHVEDFMPFTQYKLYNAGYWFTHANAHSIATAWRAAQYNGDGAMTNEEIADMCSKYRARQYYLYDRGADAEYDNFAEANLNVAGHMLLDGVDSYLGLPRELQSGSLDINGTHYIKLGNSFVEEVSLVLSCASGAAMLRNGFDKPDSVHMVRHIFDTLKYTPLYDSFYSPWKSYMDFVIYSYDSYKRDDSKDKSWKAFMKELPAYYENFVKDKSTHSEAIAGIPVIGAIASNMIGRGKAFDLNLGELMTLYIDPDVHQTLGSKLWDTFLDVTGGICPSLIGTRVEKEQGNKYDAYAKLNNILVKDPTSYINIAGRLQKMGFGEHTAKMLMQDLYGKWDAGMYIGKQKYLDTARELLAQGYDFIEVTNLLKQFDIDMETDDRFLAMYSALPGYLKYDKGTRQQVVSYYKALGYSTSEAWAKMVSNPCIIENGKLIELSPANVVLYNKVQKDTYNAIHYPEKTQEEWQAYWDSMPFRYPKGEWKEAMDYLRSAGYSYDEAMKMCLAGFMLNNEGKMVDVQGMVRAKQFSYSSMDDAAWNAYWDTVPDYTKYEKGAFGRTMKALKAQGYDDNTARALIQQGIYVDPNGVMMNVAGMERPVLGYANFNVYYQTLPDFIKYEKGAFKRTYAVLKNLGFDYETSLRLIQQGAYLIDATGIPGLLAQMTAAGASPAVRQAKKDITVFDINTLMQKHGGTPMVGADGKTYLLINCSGLQRARKTFGYSRRSYGGGRGRRGGGRAYGSYGYGGAGSSRRKPSYSPKLLQYTMRKPFIQQGNVSTYNGFTSYRGSNKMAKPYTTQGYVSTYSAQNFLNGSSYGMRKTYKIDMRQFKSGALSTKSAYPASYRNIAVAYRRNLYKDLYAKYGASRMQMRANKAGYSNASIVRLRRNEIYNRERYAERRDKKAQEKVNVRTVR